MTLVDQVIADTGGRIVASFTLDAYGRTVGAPVDQRKPYCCSVCGATGHTIRQHNTALDLRTKPEKMRDRVRAVIDAKLRQR